MSAAQDSHNQASAPTAFYWIPLGTAPSGRTFEHIGDVEIPRNLPTVQRVATAKDPNLVLELVSVIESLMDRPMSTQQRERLTAVLQKMNTDEFTVVSH